MSGALSSMPLSALDARVLRAIGRVVRAVG